MGFNFKVQDAVREKVYPKIGVFSQSGGGKTYTSLRLATGMVARMEEETGKKEQGDAVLDKTTYPAVLGLDGAIEALNTELNTARQQLTLLTDRTGKNYTGLSYFLDKLVVERGDKS